MKKLSFLCFFIVLSALAEPLATTEWYSIPDDLSDCVQSVSPASIIQDLSSKKIEFSVEEFREIKGQLLRVIIKNGPDNSRYSKKIFYKSSDDCKGALEKIIPKSYK